MGHGYKGSTGHYHSLSENISNLIATFPFNEKTGYFGQKGSGINGKSGSSNKVREISSDNPLETARKFYNCAAYGGKESLLNNGEGHKTVLKDGTVITFREVSHSQNKSPAVDINITTISASGLIKNQKIHFVKEGNK